MIRYKGPKKGRPSPRGGINRNLSDRKGQAEMARNTEMAEHLQGIGLLLTMKNVALVDISSYTRPDAQDTVSP